MVPNSVRSAAALTTLILLSGCGPGAPVAQLVASRSATGTSDALSSAAGPAPAASKKRWVPAPGTTWQWQLTVPVDTSFPAEIYDIDGFENDAAVVAKLHKLGRKVVCYIEVGSAATFRPDYRAWPPKLLGKSNGWAGERWLDIRDPAKLKPVLAKRFDMCKKKGFDAVEPDLMDAFTNNTGFPISAADQLRFNRFIADLAHQRGLSVALKNDVEQVPKLVKYFDFAVNESCAVYRECDGLTPFIKAGKAVLHTEYTLPPSAYCADSRRLRLSSLRKNLNLDAAAIRCPAR